MKQLHFYVLLVSKIHCATSRAFSLNANSEQVLYQHRSVDASPSIYTPFYCGSRIKIMCDDVQYMRLCSSDTENLGLFRCDAESLS